MRVFLKMLVVLVLTTVYANAWNIGNLATGVSQSYQDFDDGYYKAGIQRSFTRDDTLEIVTDNVTGLQWQDDTNAKTIKKTHAQAIGYCENLNFGGFTDWRLPSLVELQSIIDNSKKYSPSIFSVFQNSSSGSYCSYTILAGYTHFVWYVTFDYGFASSSYKSGSYYVRCVRVGQSDNLTLSRDSTTEIVTDNNTKLMWQDNSEVKSNHTSWSEAISYCENLTLGGYTDWRLPNKNELMSIVDYSKSSLSIKSAFQNSSYSNYVYDYNSYSNYWSSTTYANYTSSAWGVNFYGGNTYIDSKSGSSRNYVRCVRAEQYDNLTLNIGNTTGGSVTKNKVGTTFKKDTSITLTASPSVGYKFVNWSDGTTTNPYTITITKDTNLTANFGIKTCKDDSYNCPTCVGSQTLNYNNDGSGYCQDPTCTTSQKLVNGSCVAKTCKDDSYNCPTCTTYQTLKYNTDGSGYCENKSYTITKLTNNSTYGSVSQNQIGTTFVYGSSLTLTATPNAGYKFVNWSDGDTTNPKTITINSNINLTANFTALTCEDDSYNCPNKTPTLTVSASKNIIAVDESITFTSNATDSDGHIVSYSWTFGDGTTSTAINPTKTYTTAGTYTATLKVTDNQGLSSEKSVTITVTSKPTFTLSTLFNATPASTNSKISLTPQKSSYTEGESVVVTAIPESGYEFGGWNGDISGMQNPMTITISKNFNINANFVKYYKLTTTTNVANGIINITPKQDKYKHGDVVTIEASPNSGYLFESWSGVNATTNKTTITMDSDKVISATFIPKEATDCNITKNSAKLLPKDGTCSFKQKYNLGERIEFQMAYNDNGEIMKLPTTNACKVSNKDIINYSATRKELTFEENGLATLTCVYNNIVLRETFQIGDVSKEINSAIVVVGKGSDSDKLKEAFIQMGNSVYGFLYSQGYGIDEIKYFNAFGEQKLIDKDLDGKKDNVVYKSSFVYKDVENAIMDTPNSNNPLMIYLIDHGTKGGGFLIDSTNKIFASQLKTTLDSYQAKTNRKVVVVVDSCYSGAFVDMLKGKDRVVISSGTKDELVQMSTSGISFTNYFIKSLSDKKSIKDSFTLASSTYTGIVKNSHPQSDFQASSVETAPFGFLFNASAEVIKDFTGKTALKLDKPQTYKLSLEAEDALIDRENALVYAIITPPQTVTIDPTNDTDAIAINSEKIKLIYNQSTNNYSTDYTFKESGIYQIYYSVEDIAGDKYNSSNINIQVGSSTKGIEYVNTTTSNDTNTTTSNSVSLKNGWNMITSFTNGKKYSVDVLKSSGITSIFSFNPVANGYEIPTYIDTGIGYWAKANSDVVVNVTNEKLVDSTNVTVQSIISSMTKEKWNLLGTPIDTTKTELKSFGATSIWWYDPSINNYSTDNNIKAGSGFWVK